MVEKRAETPLLEAGPHVPSDSPILHGQSERLNMDRPVLKRGSAGFEDHPSLLSEVSELRRRCCLMEQEAASAAERLREKSAVVVKLGQELGEARSKLASSKDSAAASATGGKTGVDESVRCIRDVVRAELKSVARRTVGVGEAGQVLSGLACKLRDVISHTAAVSAQVTERHGQLAELIRVSNLKQSVALRKIHYCLSDSSSLQWTDAAILESCLLLFTDVGGALVAAVGPGTECTVNRAPMTVVGDECDAQVQHTLHRAQRRVNDDCSPPRSDNKPRDHHHHQQQQQSMREAATTPMKLSGVPLSFKSPLNCGSSKPISASASPVGRRIVVPPRATPPSSPPPPPRVHPALPDHFARSGGDFGVDDAFRYAVAALSAQERRYDQQHPHQVKRWVAPGKAHHGARQGVRD
ncbi:hypothetical protein DQ04_00521060 [Trypanosoma grayi]|uniref:hypothetical protein n=1 Tax=Trypanosoma grayi TaxID=71804 RepID=UPI0004F484E7|nr:hypothetical protein DQ04_00521060 [Trypanosoma grayi]KEG14321.1 hypothetical protein DQ04_00521060 [Trypanosoma grayi]